MARLMIVGPDLIAVGAVAGAYASDYAPPVGLVLVPSDTAKIGDTFDPVTGEFLTPAVPLDQRRATAVAMIEAHKARLMAAGAPYAGRRVELDDASRANLNGVVTTALLMEVGAISEWPADYALGWITLDNSRIPLPTPMDGITLGLTVAHWYSGLVQFCRSAKDAVLASEAPEVVVEGLDWSPWS
jgi:hypothetical protein